MAAIGGKPVDRVPVGMWLHNFTMENSADALVQESCRLLERFDLDFVKPQQRASFFSEMWGQRYVPSTRIDEFPRITHHAIQSSGDLGNLRRVRVNHGALAEQVEMIGKQRAAVGPDVPIVATVFAPMMNLTLMHARGRDGALGLQREAPEQLAQAVDAMAGTLADFAAACVDNGADGIFYATKTANVGDASRAEFERFQKAADLAILGAVRDAPMNILHICGDAIQAEWFVDYPVSVISWATTPGNPGLADMRGKTGKAVMSGMPAKPHFARLSAEQLRAHVQAALDETAGVGHIVGPDCSINPGTADSLIEPAIRAARDWRPGNR